MANSNEKMCTTISEKVWNDKVKECDNWKEKYLSTYSTNCLWANTLQEITGLNKKLQKDIKDLNEEVKSLKCDLEEAWNETQELQDEDMKLHHLHQKLKKVKLGSDMPCSWGALLDEVSCSTTGMPSEKHLLQAVEELVEANCEKNKAISYSEEQMDHMAKAFGFDEDYATDTCFDWSCFVRDCPVKNLKEENKKMKRLIEDFEDVEKMSKQLRKFQERSICEKVQELKDVKQELKEASMEQARLYYEKWWMLGDDGNIYEYIEFDQVHQDFKDGKIKDEETYKYLLDAWGWDEEEDLNKHN